MSEAFNAEEAKSAFKSKTVQGGIVALLGALAPMALSAVGITDAAAQADVWNEAVVAFGSALAIYGRFAAAGKVKL